MDAAKGRLQRVSTICRLKRYTTDDTRQCLANQHLNFIGDSLSRYQFYSLAYFIDKGMYPPRFPTPSAYDNRNECRSHHVDDNNTSQCSPETEPNICTEVDWRRYRDRSWSMLFSVLGGSDDGGVFGGRMECNCGRKDGESQIIENMIYASQPDGKNERAVLSLFLERGWGDNMDPIRGHSFIGCGFNESCRLSETLQDTTLDRARHGSYDYNQSFPEAIDPEHGALRHIIPPVNIAIYNRGLWGALDPGRAALIFPAMFNWTGGAAGRCFFKSTTASGRPSDRDLHQYETQPAIRTVAVNAGCSFLDYGHITSDFANLHYEFPEPPGGGGLERTDVYWDVVHFMPWVYEELNNVLLNVLCNGRDSDAAVA